MKNRLKHAAINGIPAALIFLSGFSAVRAQAQDTKPYLAVFQLDETVPAAARKISESTITGNDRTKECAHYELLMQAKEQAVQSGANALKIIRRTEHSKTKPCDVLTVAFYTIPNAQSAEQSFEWNPARPLQWDDFMGSVRADAGPAAVAETSCGIAIETNLAANGERVKVYVYNIFNKQESWVKPGFDNNDVLEHEQGHWNLCELYTRRMQERFDEMPILGASLHKMVEKIYDEVSREYQDRQEQYERETAHGTIANAQHRWTKIINEELHAGLTFKL